VGALRALATDVDTRRLPKDEWRRRNEATGVGLVPVATEGELGYAQGRFRSKLLLS
jgi:hypothetical protein